MIVIKNHSQNHSNFFFKHQDNNRFFFQNTISNHVRYKIRFQFQKKVSRQKQKIVQKNARLSNKQKPQN